MGPRPPSRPESKGGKSGQNLKQSNSNKIRRGPKTVSKAKPGTMGSRIQKLRRELGLTQNEFAQRVGVGQAAVSAWEIGTGKASKISAPALDAVCRVLGTSAGFLRTGRETPAGAAEGEPISIHLPPIMPGTAAMQVERRGLTAESLTLTQAQKLLREAVKAGKPVWVVLG
jgi:transcriptional regulator with XRE-family HTH domain